MSTCLTGPSTPTRRGSTALEWDGIDPTPATGIDFFRLQGRANGGEWQALAPTLRTYGGDFEGTNGKRVKIAIQPVDPAGNVVPQIQPHAVTHFDFSAPATRVLDLPPYVPGPFEVKWSGVDLPDGQIGSGIASWTVLYNIGAGSWGLVAADMPVEQTSIRFDKVQQGLLYQFQVLATDKAGHRRAARRLGGADHHRWRGPRRLPPCFRHRGQVQLRCQLDERGSGRQRRGRSRCAVPQR